MPPVFVLNETFCECREGSGSAVAQSGHPDIVREAEVQMKTKIKVDETESTIVR